MELAVGQIWKEVDPRFERFVRIVGVHAGTVGNIQIRTAVRIDGKWQDAPRSRSSYANPERFNGKRGNYTFVEMADAIYAVDGR